MKALDPLLFCRVVCAASPPSPLSSGLFPASSPQRHVLQALLFSSHRLLLKQIAQRSPLPATVEIKRVMALYRKKNGLQRINSVRRAICGKSRDDRRDIGAETFFSGLRRESSVIPRVERCLRREVLAEDVLPEGPDSSGSLPASVLHRRDGEDRVELLERETLGLRDGGKKINFARCVRSKKKGRTSGTKKSVRTAPTAFQAAYQPKAPVGVKAVRRRGKVRATMKLKPQRRAVAYDMPAEGRRLAR